MVGFIFKGKLNVPKLLANFPFKSSQTISSQMLIANRIRFTGCIYRRDL